MLVVVLIGLLAALSIPTLSGVRDTARDGVSLSNLRTHAQVLTMYASDSNGLVAGYADPDATFSVVRGCDDTLAFPYFEAVHAWATALCDGYYSGRGARESFFHPDADRDDGVISYFLSSSLLASPPYWERRTRTGPDQWRIGRLSDVAFASGKALFTEWHPRRGLPIAPRGRMRTTGGIGLGFADASAGRFNPAGLLQPYPFGDGQGEGTWLPIGVYGMHTVRGWIGRDRR